jgi:GT2 family glycosyltransferase
MMSAIDIVIPTYNGIQLLRQHLPSLLDCAPEASVTVVDDGSSDGSVEILRGEFPSVNVVARGANGGFSVTANEGIRASASEFVLLLNNDVDVTPGFLDPIMPLFDDDDVFAVSPRVLLPTKGNLDEGAKTGFWHHGMFYTGQREGVSEISPILYVTGCAAVYRRSMLEELGGFDEVYSPFYKEDADLGYRAWKRGWRSLYQPASSVRHEHSASISKVGRGFVDTIKARNAFFFVWRNIEDPELLRRHQRWLPLVIAKNCLTGDRCLLQGYRLARPYRGACDRARREDSTHRKLSDREIFDRVGVRTA